MREHINKPEFLPDEEGTVLYFNDILSFIPKHPKKFKGGKLTISFWDGKKWIPFSDNTDNKFETRPPGNPMGM